MTSKQARCSRPAHLRFERWAQAFPERVALSHEYARLTYGELNAAANKLAHHLIAEIGAVSGGRVCLVLSKTEWTIICILAVWKAGAMYVPLDPAAPDRRIADAFEEIDPHVILADRQSAQHVRALARQGGSRVLNVMDLVHSQGGTADPEMPIADGAVAYGIYTSGTMGHPKAVLVSHSNLSSFVQALDGVYGDPDPADPQVVLFLANYIFDFSLEQIAMSLLRGGRLVIPSIGFPYAGGSYDWLHRENITFISGTPSHIAKLDLSRFPHLRRLVLAGEPFRADQFQRIRSQYAGVVCNAYGTTETTVYNAVQCFGPGEAYTAGLGRPLANSSFYLISEDGRPAASDGMGELYISGDCVSLGYLGRDEETARRFLTGEALRARLADRSDGEVLYRTGDMMRNAAPAGLEFVGRADRQVKVQGIRIELGEIECCLGTLPGIVERAVVVAPPDLTRGRDEAILAFYTGADDLDEAQVLLALRARLPSALVPARAIRVRDNFPLTGTGKLDEQALLALAGTAVPRCHEPPLNRVEAQVLGVWRETLGLDHISATDDFFALGGDSISAMRLVSGLRRAFGEAVRVRDVFELATPRALAQRLRSEGFGLASATAARAEGECPLLPIQNWFFAKSLLQAQIWNQFFTLQTPTLDVDRLARALQALADHHDAFRLRFERRDGPAGPTVRQSYADSTTLPLTLLEPEAWLALDGDYGSLAEQAFDLERGPLAHAFHLKGLTGDRDCVMIVMHHLIVDVVSWGVIAQDLEILYHGGSLEAAGASYNSWATAVANYEPGPSERRTWADMVQALRTNGLVVQEASQGLSEAAGAFALDEARAVILTQLSQEIEGGGMQDVLAAATASALRDCGHKGRIFITLEGHGREQIDGAGDVHNLVGWFTTLYPVEAFPADGSDGRRIIDAVARTSDARRAIPFNGVGFGCHLGGGDRAEGILPPISLNFLGRYRAAPSRAGATEDPSPGRWWLDPEAAGMVTSAVDRERALSRSSLDVTAKLVNGRLLVDVAGRVNMPAKADFSSRLQHWLTRFADILGPNGLGSPNASSGEAAAAARRSLADDAYISTGNPGSARKLALFPPAEGGVESYLGNLAKALDQFDLVHFSNLAGAPGLDSIEAIARRYVDLLDEAQPSATYSLLGWSLGAIIAMEVSLQLQALGKRVEHLFLIDPLFEPAKCEEALAGMGDAFNFGPLLTNYTPDERGLRELASGNTDVVLFQADRVPDQDMVIPRRVFRYYVESRANRLDDLLPISRLKLVRLHGFDHFDWVKDKACVLRIAEEVRSSDATSAVAASSLAPLVVD